VAEVLDERGLVTSSGIKMGSDLPPFYSRSTIKTILVWVVILFVVVGLWNLIERY
jgi:hypothetical protein